MAQSNIKSVPMLPMNLAIPLYVAPEDGQLLFREFVHQQFETEHEPEDMLMENIGEGDANGFVDENFAYAHNMVFAQAAAGPNVVANSPEGYKSILTAQVGVNIRELANEFAQSRQRQLIRQNADEVDLGSMTFDRFWVLLEEVFRHGINQHNLIALFFFCSDILIRCVRCKMRDIGINLFRWTLRYIADRVCKWVQENGGWEKAISRAFITNKKLAIAIGAVVVVAVGWMSIKIIKNS